MTLRRKGVVMLRKDREVTIIVTITGDSFIVKDAKEIWYWYENISFPVVSCDG